MRGLRGILRAVLPGDRRGAEAGGNTALQDGWKSPSAPVPSLPAWQLMALIYATHATSTTNTTEPSAWGWFCGQAQKGKVLYMQVKKENKNKNTQTTRTGLPSHKLKTSVTWARRGRQEMAP